MRVSVSKNEHYVFNKFLRKYKAALENLSLGQMISNDQVMKTLTFLGYTDQYINQHTQQMCHTISYMLSENKDCLVSRGSLFQFLRIISDVRKYPALEFFREVRGLANDLRAQKMLPLIVVRFGTFDEHGEWKCTAQEEKQIKKMFGSMNLKRISRQNIEAQNKQNSQIFKQQTFKPQILNKSRNMAQGLYKRLSISKNSKVQDRLLQNQSLQKSRLQVQVNKSMQKSMKECYFKPKINTPKRQIVSYSLCKYVDSVNTSFQNKQNDKSLSNVISHQNSTQSISKSKASLVGDKLLNKGKQYENHIEKLKDEYKQLNDFFQMKQCTFQPKLYQKAYGQHHLKPHSMAQITNPKALRVKNAEKSVERVKQARKKRQFENQVKQRGYPQNIAWTKFMNSYKSQNCYQNKTPILCIDLKIMDSTKNIKVYQGQRVEQISEKICVQNEVPHQFWVKVQNLIKSSIERCNEVRIHQDKIFLNR